MNKLMLTTILAALCCNVFAYGAVHPDGMPTDAKTDAVQDSVAQTKNTLTGEDSTKSVTDTASTAVRRKVREHNALRRSDVSATCSRFSLSTNIADWGLFITPNLSAQLAVGQHWTLLAEAKYNNWSFNDTSRDNRIRQARQEYSFGVRWWGWYTYTGWWVGCRAMYREYSGNRVLAHSFPDWGNRYLKEEGDAFGLAANFGYSFQITRWLDIDLGIGVWGGLTIYRQYSGEKEGEVCPRYGRRIDAPLDAPSSKAFFAGPSEVCISLIFIL